MNVSRVTDHAVLRYLERECGLDVEALRDLIAGVTARGMAAGAPVVKLGGCRFILADGKVVTTLVTNKPPTFESLKRAMKGRYHEADHEADHEG